MTSNNISYANKMEQILTFKKRIIGDCLKELPLIKNIDLIITDPPYNINWNYGNNVNDNKKNYDEWCLKWASLCFNTLNKKGVICIINYPENNNKLFVELVNKGYNFIQQLIWCYPTNIGHSKKKYTRSYRTILVFSLNKDYTFNPLKQPYKNLNDKRIKELIKNGSRGTNLYDVFNINLCKNVSKSKRNKGINQLPDKLVDILLQSFSDPFDTILDPFMGNGTVINQAEKWGRNGIGIDINDFR